MIRENQKVLNRLFVTLDAVVLILSFLIAWAIRFKSGLIFIDTGYLSFNDYVKPALLIIPLYLVFYHMFNLYSVYRLKSIYDEVVDVIKANTIVFFVFVLMLFIFKEIDYSRWLLAIYWIVNNAMVCLERISVRYFLRKLRKNNFNLKHIILIGLSENAFEFIKKVKINKQWGYSVVGIVSDDVDSKAYEKEMAARKENIRFLGGIKDLKEILEAFAVDEVYITLNMKEYDKLGFIIPICENIGVRTQIIPAYTKYIPARPYVDDIDGLPVINIRYVPLDSIVNIVIKRVFDIAASIAVLIVFSPFMAIIALIIKMTSPGPVLFKQERVGFNRKIFLMYKFRSMKLQTKSDEEVAWTQENDPRKTKFGTFLRKTSLDELPQLFNVLKGDMSLIGPRPERPYFVDKFKDEIPKYMIKHHVKPGMTGWAQVNGFRGDTSIEERISYDIYYIENWSLTLDFKICWLTLFRGFVNKNAY